MNKVENLESHPHIVRIETQGMRVCDTLPWCFLLFVFGVPFSIVWAHIALGLWLLAWFVSLSLGQVQWKRTPLDIPVFIFLGVDLLTALLGVNPARSLVHFVSLWHVSIYILVVNTVPNEKWLRRGLAILLAVTALNASYGIVQHFGGGPYFFRDQQFVFRWSNSLSKEVGTFDHSMTFSGQMVLVGLLGLSLLMWKRINMIEWWKSVPVGVILIALVLSFSRNAWFGGLVGTSALGFMKGGRTIIGLGIAISVVIFYLVFMAPFPFNSQVKNIVNPEYPSNRERIEMIRVTLDMLKANPILGVGGGNYGAASEVYRQEYGVVSKSHPHNNLFSQTAEKGLLGLGAFLYIWYIFFKVAWIAWKNSADALSRAMTAGGIAALAGFHASGMFEANFGDSEVAMMMWLIVGFVMLIRIREDTLDFSR